MKNFRSTIEHRSYQTRRLIAVLASLCVLLLITAYGCMRKATAQEDFKTLLGKRYDAKTGTISIKSKEFEALELDGKKISEWFKEAKAVIKKTNKGKENITGEEAKALYCSEFLFAFYQTATNGADNLSGYADSTVISEFNSAFGNKRSPELDTAIGMIRFLEAEQDFLNYNGASESDLSADERQQMIIRFAEENTEKHKAGILETLKNTWDSIFNSSDSIEELYSVLNRQNKTLNNAVYIFGTGELLAELAEADIMASHGRANIDCYYRLAKIIFLGVGRYQDCGWHLPTESEFLTVFKECNGEYLLNFLKELQSIADPRVEEYRKTGSLADRLIYNSDSIARKGTDVVKIFAAFILILITVIKVIQMLNVSDASLEDWMKILVVFFGGILLIAYYDTILKYTEQLGLWLFKNITIRFGGLNASDFHIAAELGSYSVSGLEKTVYTILLFLSYFAIYATVFSLLMEIALRRALIPIAIVDLLGEGFRAPGLKFLISYLMVYVRMGMTIIILLLGSTTMSIMSSYQTIKAGTALGTIGVILCIRTAMKAMMNATGTITRELY